MWLLTLAVVCYGQDFTFVCIFSVCCLPSIHDLVAAFVFVLTVVYWCRLFEDPRTIHFQMAFCNKVGSLLRQGISQNGQVTMASMFNSARYMSSKLFVGGMNALENSG